MADQSKGKGKQIDFSVVVNGEPTTVKAHEGEPLGTIIPDEGGKLLDATQLIGSFDFPKRVRLFLNLKAGVGG